MAELEKQAADLSPFLSGRTPKDIHDVTTFDSKCFKRAHVMLCAEDLLEAAKYALTLLQRLSTEDFAAGGDKPAREKLKAAITNRSGAGLHFHTAALAMPQPPSAVAISATPPPGCCGNRPGPIGT